MKTTSPCGFCLNGGQCKEPGIYGNLYIRPIVFGDKGSIVQGHWHHLDHVTLIATGAVTAQIITSDGTVIAKDYAAPAFIEIPKTLKHTFIAKEANTTGFCVFPLIAGDDITPYRAII